MKILFGLAFLLCISVGYSLKCYRCLSFHSWDECRKSTVQVNCLYGQDRCAKARVKFESSAATLEGFVKGCDTSSACSAVNCKSISPSVEVTKCEINCCKGDLCNGAKVPKVSAIMLLSCAIMIVAFAQ